MRHGICWISLPKRNRGFTLLELLMVVGIITLALAALGSVTSRVLGSQTLNSATRELANYLIMARAEAVRHQTITQIRFVTDESDVGAASGEAFRSFSIWSLEDSDGPTYLPLTGWRELPEGVILEPDFPGYAKQSNYAQNDGTTVRGDYILKSETSPETVKKGGKELPYRFIEFLPTGGARIPEGENNQSIIVAVEGYLEAPGKMVRTAPKKDLNSSAIANWSQINITNLTGNVRIYRP
ncbi:MAG: prepilin-type N-terminal cleavage/methylation domain-containing protein [Verrucomicrobiota bacterium]